MFQKFLRFFSKAADRERIILRRITRILDLLRRDNLTILDDGTGQGLIARGLATRGFIIGIDQIPNFVKAKNKLETAQFLIAVGEFLPFKPESFDVIISQMVLEHVFNVEKYLKEINFVLKEKGFVYLALPNRLFPIEPHTGIPIIPYLPHGSFQKIVNAKMGKEYPLNYLTYKILNIISKVGFKKIQDLVLSFLKNSDQFYPSIPLFLCQLLAKAYGITRFFIPTWIWLLEKTT